MQRAQGADRNAFSIIEGQTGRWGTLKCSQLNFPIVTAARHRTAAPDLSTNGPADDVQLSTVEETRIMPLHLTLTYLTDVMVFHSFDILLIRG